MTSATANGSTRRRLLAAYVVLLAASHLVRWLRSDTSETAGPAVTVPAVAAGRAAGFDVRIAYHEWAGATPDAPVVLLVHGSPGRGADLARLARAFPVAYRRIVPDLPGFGASTGSVPDYSFPATAAYLEELLDALAIDRAHVVAVSQGGGAAIELAARSRRRVRSLTLLSAVGVQELELLGDYRLNHGLYALQWGTLWLATEALPHFGVLDAFPLNLAYARSFLDADQRPLRGLLERLDGPVLIVHGRDDSLVPLAAAVEHARIVPQAELAVLEGRHFIFFNRPEAVARRISDFLDAVEGGSAATRGTAPADRGRAAALPFLATSGPPATGIMLGLFVFLLAVATLVSEDLTCIAAGLLVARGTLGFVPAAAACGIGIWGGDVLLYLAGRYLGRAALGRAPLRWMVSAEALAAREASFARRGTAVIFAARFLPGSRLAMYVAAGVLRFPPLRFAVTMLLAVALWTPALVALAAALGHAAVGVLGAWARSSLTALLVVVAAYLVITRGVIPLSTYRGRRLWVSRWRRLTRWEFWPLWVFDVPVVAHWLWLSLRHRSLTVFTAANPEIPASGFVLESKAAILSTFAAGGAPVARFRLIGRALAAEERLAAARGLMTAHDLGFPVVVKPDVGQRGEGVTIVRDEDALRERLAATAIDVLVQEHVPGVELGVFYVRHPDEPRGSLFSITAKELPEVVGDGRRTLEELILGDDRAVCMARTFLDRHAARLQNVPAEGERVPLVEVGNHCRGAVFRDGSEHATEALTACIDSASRGANFYFGRFDVRAPTLAAMRAGRDVKIIEVNGVTSEATHIYAPGASLLVGYRVLFEQWRLAFAIGAANAARGVPVTSLGDLVRMLRLHLRGERRALAQVPPVPPA